MTEPSLPSLPDIYGGQIGKFATTYTPGVLTAEAVKAAVEKLRRSSFQTDYRSYYRCCFGGMEEDGVWRVCSAIAFARGTSTCEHEHIYEGYTCQKHTGVEIEACGACMELHEGGCRVKVVNIRPLWVGKTDG